MWGRRFFRQPRCLSQALPHILDERLRVKVFRLQVRSIEMQVGDNPDTMLEMVKDQHGLGKTEYRLWQSQFIAFRHGQTFETRRRLIGQVADRSTMKSWQFIVSHPGRCYQTILA